jgi:hypothetical protein
MKVGKWCFGGVTKSNRLARGLLPPGAAFIILGHGQQRCGRLLIRDGEGEAAAASGLVEALLAMDGLGICALRLRRSEHHGGCANTGAALRFQRNFNEAVSCDGIATSFSADA